MFLILNFVVIFKQIGLDCILISVFLNFSVYLKLVLHVQLHKRDGRFEVLG